MVLLKNVLAEGEDIFQLNQTLTYLLNTTLQKEYLELIWWFTDIKTVISESIC